MRSIDRLQSSWGGPIVTSHALQRWQERVVPGSSQGQAETQILNFIELGEVLTKVPDWIRGPHFQRDRWIACSSWPGVVLQVQDRDAVPVVKTVLVAPTPITTSQEV